MAVRLGVYAEWNVQDLQDVVTEALQITWTKSQRSIVKNTAKIESLYDTISRVEDALAETPPYPGTIHPASSLSVGYPDLCVLCACPVRR